MPKANRKRVAQRGQVELNTSIGSSNVPAAVRSNAAAPGGGRGIVSSNNYSSSIWASMSGTFAELARQVEKAQDKAEAEATYQRRRAEQKADQAARDAEAREEAKLNALQAAAGRGAGMEWAYSALNKLHSGTYSNGDEPIADFKSKIAEIGDENAAFIRAFTETAGKHLESISYNLTTDLSDRTTNNLLGTMMQSQGQLFNNLDNISDEEFVEFHLKTVKDAEAAGIPSHSIEDALVSGATNQYIKATQTDPALAGKYYDYMKAWSKHLTNRTSMDKLSATFHAGLSATEATAKRLDAESAKAEEKRKNTEYSYIFGRVVQHGDPAKLTAQIAALEANYNSVEENIGPDLAAKLIQDARSQLTFLENRGEHEWRLKEAEGKRVLGEYFERMLSGDELPSLYDLQNDDRLLPFQKADMWQRAEQYRAMIDGRLAEPIENALTSLKERYPRESSSQGGYVEHDGIIEFDPNLIGYFRTQLKKAAFDAYRSIAPNDADSEYKQMMAVTEAVKYTSENLLKNTHQAPVKLDSAFQNSTGTLRPKVTEMVDLGLYPEQRDDIERGLFSAKTGIAKVRNGTWGRISTDFNVNFYRSLTPEGQAVANELLITRGVDDYIKRKEAHCKAGNFAGFMHVIAGPSVDPGILHRDSNSLLYKNQKYDLDLTEDSLEQ